MRRSLGAQRLFDARAANSPHGLSTPPEGSRQGARSAAARACRRRDGAARLWAAPLTPEARSALRGWAPAHLAGPLAGPGGSSRAAHARCAPPPPHAPPRARTRRSAHTAPDLPARTGPARTQRAAVSPRPLARPRPQVCATTAARAADGDAARRGEPAAAKRWSGAGSIPERPAGLPVALESYSSRGRGRRAAGDGMRMRLSIRFYLFRLTFECRCGVSGLV